MKDLFATAVIAAVMLPAFTWGAARPLTLAVFDFEAKDAGDLGKNISSLLNATLSVDANVVTVERAELNKVIGEQELSLSGTVSVDTAAKVGHLTGARILVTGRVFKLGNDNVIVAKVIGTETSRVYGEMVKGRGEPADLAADLSGKILKTIADKADTLVVRAEPREDRLKALKLRLSDGKRPSVFVRLPERHYGTPVNDPAAETEFMKMLQSTGFTLVDSEGKAEIVVGGEAFSAAAGRKGNLLVARARVEIKAVLVKTGEILVVDRETSVAVDLAEQTAGKTALQHAAEEIALRAIPKLAK